MVVVGHGAGGTLTGSGGPFAWPTTSPVEVPTLLEDWTVPDPLLALVGVLDQNAGLRFLQFAQRTRCTLGTSLDPLAQLVQVPHSSSLEALLDDQLRPYCLWLRTLEPLDWRRVSGLLEVVTDSSSPSSSVCALDISILPSPDGTSAFLLAVSHGRALRLPAGNMRLSLKYYERVQGITGLPVLQRVMGATSVANEVWSQSFHQPFGFEWSA